MSRIPAGPERPVWSPETPESRATPGRTSPAFIVFLLVLCGFAAGCGGDGGGGTIEPPATATLTGTVRKAGTQTAIAGATVNVGGASTTSGANGQFELSNVSIGPAIAVQVNAARFDSHVQTIAVQAGANTLDIFLAPQTLYVHGDAVAYLPPEVTEYRGVLFFLSGSDGDSRFLVRGEAPAVCREWCTDWASVRQSAIALARTHRLALFGMKSIPDGSAAYAALFAALAGIAAQSGHSQLASVPMLLFGHSAGGCLAYGFTRVHSARVIGFISGKGGCHSPFDAGTLGAHSVPAYFFIGEDDTPDRATNITMVFEQNRAQGALWALGIEPGAAHGTLRNAGLQISWMDAVLARRLNPPGTPVGVRTVAEAAGWLGNRATFAIADYATYEDDPLQASWLPSQQTALDWQELVNEVGGE